MTDLLLRIGVSNLCISLALALVAWVVQSTGKRPLLAHLLWLLVLAKLVTPPILTVPVVEVPWLSAPGAEAPATDSEPSAANLGEVGVVAIPDTATNVPAALWSATVSWSVERGKTVLILLWLVGSVCVLTWSLRRVHRFHRLLAIACQVAPPRLQSIASRLAYRLGLAATPTIYLTSAHVSPMVWWIGGRVRVVIPAALTHEMNDGKLRWILAHELAHVRRRDHLVRWLEWLACVCFWWNPVAWWARRNLRANEEVCCDALVLFRLKPNPRTYANSLLTAVEFLASPALRPPVMASEINSGGFLERRFEMIVSGRSLSMTPRWLHGLFLICGVGLLPLAVAHAQDLEAVERRLGAGVAEGELTLKQAVVMMDALRRVAQEDGRRRTTREDYARAEERIRRAVAEGRISGEDARARLGEMRRAMAEQAERRRGDERRITREDFARAAEEIRRAIAEGEVSEEAGRTRLAEMRRAMAEEGERDPDTGIEGYYREMGVGEEMFARFRHALLEGRVPDELVDHVLRAMVRVIQKMRTEGDRFDLDPRMREYLSERLRLTEDQIRLVVGLAQRVALSDGSDRRSRPEHPDARDDSGIEGHFREMGIVEERLARIQRALLEEGIPDEKLEHVLGAMLRVIHEVRSEGNAFELDPGLREYLSRRLRLSEEQIRLVVGLALRVAEGGRSTERERGEEDSDGGDDARVKEYRAIEARIRAAVEAGEVSEEDAEKRLVELRKRMFGT